MTRDRRAATVAAAVVAAVVVAVWWAWPTLAGHDARLDVLVVGDPFLDPGRRSVELRVREDGRSVAWTTGEEAGCGDPATLRRAVDDLDPQVVVVSIGADASCATTLAAALEGQRVVAVVQPGAGPDAAALAAAGFEVVDPERLIGDPGDDPRRVCEWWESCDGDGRIAVREESGALTTAGNERVARMIVAAL